MPKNESFVVIRFRSLYRHSLAEPCADAGLGLSQHPIETLRSAQGDIPCHLV